MHKINILLLGNRSHSNRLGNFAQMIKTVAESRDDVDIETQLSETYQPNIVIYANRTPEQLGEAKNICERFSIPILMLSTGLEDECKNVLGDDTTVIYKPNTSLHTLKFIDDIHEFGKRADWCVSGIDEWHQSSKQDISGTAVHIAKLMHFPTSKINSVRDDKVAKVRFGLESVEAYAIHKIVFTHKTIDSKREFTLVTIGRDSYASGAIDIAKSITNK